MHFEPSINVPPKQPPLLLSLPDERLHRLAVVGLQGGDMPALLILIAEEVEKHFSGYRSELGLVLDADPCALRREVVLFCNEGSDLPAVKLQRDPTMTVAVVAHM
jgi:hypothetical protein